MQEMRLCSYSGTLPPMRMVDISRRKQGAMSLRTVPAEPGAVARLLGIKEEKLVKKDEAQVPRRH